MKKIFVAIILLVCMLLSVAGCASHPLEGRYDTLTDEIFDQKCSIVLTVKDEQSGTYVMYDEYGQLLTSTNRRYAWALEEDMLLLEKNGDVYRRFVVKGNALIRTNSDGSIPLYDYIAPKGKRFDWACGGYEFSDDGTYTYYRQKGNYYVKNNTIFVAPEGEEEYEAKYYIYDGEYVAPADYVLVKK